MMKILAIDTSCDDASVAISMDECLAANVVFSQVEQHSVWGGVVPSLAKRQHQESINATIDEALRRAKMGMNDIDVIAVTTGPGLAIALEVGVLKAKSLALQYNLPIIGVNHMAGHMLASFARNRAGGSFSNLTDEDREVIFPFVSLLISGGHTELILASAFESYQVLGRTKDDAIGEAYDKVARMLSLGYPGGPILERLAAQGNRFAHEFPISMRDGGLDFSYSGLKTSVLRTVQLNGRAGLSLREQYAATNSIDLGVNPALSMKPTYELEKQMILDIAASFEYAATEQLAYKLRKCLEEHRYVKYVVLGGGVVNNRYVRDRLRVISRKLGAKLIYPKVNKLITDNAGMIAIAGYYKIKKYGFDTLDQIDRRPNWELGS